MKKQVRELVEYAERCGFVLDGMSGSGHYMLRHPNGSSKVIPATPSDRRGFATAKAEFRKLSGVDPDDRRSGSYKRGMPRERFVPATERVESRSFKTDHALKRFRKVCKQIRHCQEFGGGDRLSLCRELLDVEAELERLGEPIPPYPFRMKFWGEC